MLAYEHFGTSKYSPDRRSASQGYRSDHYCSVGQFGHNNRSVYFHIHLPTAPKDPAINERVLQLNQQDARRGANPNKRHSVYLVLQ